MKKINAWLFLSVIVVAVSCKDDEPESNSITADEAAVIISSSLASNTSGVNLVTSKSADVTGDLLEDNAGGRVAACGLTQNLDFSGENPTGAEITYSYDFSYKFALKCAEDEPTSVTVDLSYNGEFDAPKIAAEHSGVAELDITSLGESAETLLMNGHFKRSGSFENKELQKSISCSIEINLDEIIVDKKTEKIIGGTGSYDISGSVPDKGTFKYTGQVTFSGADLAEINVKGSKFASNLKSGTVTKK